MIIGVLGGEGFVGSSLAEALEEEHRVLSITRENYTKIKKMNLIFDIFINCAGNASKRKANKYPIESLKATVESVYQAEEDFQC